MTMSLISLVIWLAVAGLFLLAAWADRAVTRQAIVGVR